MADRTTIFADGILDASVHAGVARLTLAQQGNDGKPQPCGQLIVPLSQLPLLTNSLLTLMKQIEGRLKEAQAKGQSAAEPDIAAIPGAFRFG